MSENIVNLKQADFESEVLESKVPVLVDFWAEWCGPCKAIAPVLEDLADEYKDRLKVVKINVDNNGQLAERFNVSGIPNIKFFAKGEEVDQKLGFASYDELDKKIKALI